MQQRHLSEVWIVAETVCDGSNNVCDCVNELKMPLRLQEIKSYIAMSPFTLSDMIRLLLHGAFFTFI